MGKLFVIDGTDGSGKQTQLETLKKRMIEENIKYNTVSRKTILYEIIRKYYMLPSIYKDNGKELFNYDIT